MPQLSASSLLPISSTRSALTTLAKVFGNCDEMRCSVCACSVPSHREFYPNIVYAAPSDNPSTDPLLRKLVVELEEGWGEHHLEFYPSTKDLLAPRVTIVERTGSDGGGKLHLQRGMDEKDCHFHHTSNHTYAAISNCDGNLVSRYLDPRGCKTSWLI